MGLIYAAVKISFYCHCSECCGKVGGLTASGTVPLPYTTIAAHRGIPLGTVAYVSSKTLGWHRKRVVVEDRMSRSAEASRPQRIDVYIGDSSQHARALALGLQDGFVEFEIDERATKTYRGRVVVEPKFRSTTPGLHDPKKSTRRAQGTHGQAAKRPRGVRKRRSGRSVCSNPKTRKLS